MEHRCHFAHGKHELRKQTDPLPQSVSDLYQTPVSTTAPPGYVHNKYKTVPCKNFQTEGYCKYGDRCTFAHGEVDLREKFVPASTMYSATTPGAPGGVAESYQKMSPPIAVEHPASMAGYSSGYSGVIDYSAFSQPPDMVASYGMAGMGKDMAYGYYGMEQEAFQMPSAFPPTYESQPSPYCQQFADPNNGYASEFKPMISSGKVKSTKKPAPAFSQETSKFGFGYESLSQNIDELELAAPNESSEIMFDRAKTEMTFGNEAEAEAILKQMFENGEIRYKQFSEFSSNLLMNTFAPIQDF